MSVKKELIKKWESSFNNGRCELPVTCDIIRKQRSFSGDCACNFCPLRFCKDREILCLRDTWGKISKGQFSIMIEMAKEIPAKYYTASGFNRKKFQPIYDFIQKELNK